MAEKRSNPDQFQLRLPPGMRGRLKDEAQANARSLNAEIVARLDDSFNNGASKEALLEANARAEKYEILMRQARARLGILREDRDKLASYVKAVNEGVEEDFEGIRRIDQLDERTLLTKLYFEVMRLSSELILLRGYRSKFDLIVSRDEEDKT